MDIKLPEEVWLVGKGPSLDTFDWSTAGPCRIGINQTAYLIPDCWGAITLDIRILKKYKKKLDSNVLVFVSEPHSKEFTFPNMYVWDAKKEIRNDLAISDNFATAGTIINILYYHGVKKIHFIGFDSMYGDYNYARCIVKARAEGENTHGYKYINQDIKTCIEAFNIKDIWYHVEHANKYKKHLQESLDIKLPEEIWIAGKGPSFDGFDWSTAGPCRIGINETAFLIPDCFGAMGIDHRILQLYMDKLDPNIIVFRKYTKIQFHYPRMYIWQPEIDVKEIFASAPTAIQIFHHLGARVMHFVGFDSMHGDINYAKSISKINAEGNNHDKYKSINSHLMKWITNLGITPVWEHKRR